MPAALRAAGRVAAPLLILTGAGAVAAYLIATRPEPAREPPAPRGALVEARTVHRRPHRLDVTAYGTVVPARTLTVRPQVSGRVARVHPHLAPGGRVRAGELLFEIERDEYALAVREARTALGRARARLEVERGRHAVARREWRRFGDAIPADGAEPALAQRLPQLREARLAVEAAAARLDRARLALDRTRVRAPFDAFVRDESVELGQLVDPGVPVATLVGTRTFWVEVAVPVDRLAVIALPGAGDAEGARATVVHEGTAGDVVRPGRVVQLRGDLEPNGRMARLLVAIEDPFGAPGVPPLLVGSFVRVDLEGARVEPLIAVPRAALRDGREVWVYAGGRLDIRRPEIAWGLPDVVLVRDGLADGDRIVTSRIPAPVEGMRLRLAADPAPDG